MANIEKFKEDFSRLIDRERLSHAYLFFGRARAEHENFAKWFCNFLESSAYNESPKVLLDALFIDARENGGIDAMKGAILFLWQKPFKSLRRTLFISFADSLT